jgi:predicted methyltransferase
MMKSLILGATSAILIASAGTPAQADHHAEGEKAMQSAKAMIEKAVKDNAFRDALDMERDQYRNPIETLDFFGIKPTDTLVEVGPGGGWYTKILAPLVAEKGKYIAVNGMPTPGTDRYTRSMQWRETFIDDSGKFGKNASARYVGGPVPYTVPDSVDSALIFRGMHGQLAYGNPEALLAELYTTLKPGGVLGIVQHREREDVDTDPRKKMRGYVKQSYIIDLVEKAGFELAGTSEINANPKDPADWEKGVWTLQAGTPIAKKDKKFREIGESDRMTLKFVKPAK